MPNESAQSLFVLPDLGEGLSEAEVLSWHVQPGDHVVADQPLLTVETDKAVVTRMQKVGVRSRLIGQGSTTSKVRE